MTLNEILLVVNIDGISSIAGTGPVLFFLIYKAPYN